MLERLQHLIKRLSSVLKEELGGEESNTNLRLKKGELLTEIEEAGRQVMMKDPGALGGKDGLQYAVEVTRDILAGVGLHPRLDKTEVATVRGAWGVVKQLGGPDTTFKDKFAVSSASKPLVNDAGQYYERNITSISVNRLYRSQGALFLAETVGKDELLSLAYNTPERDWSAFAALARRHPRDVVTNFLTNFILEGRYREGGLLREAKAEFGEDTSVEFRNVTLEKEFYETEYRPVIQGASLILGALGKLSPEQDTVSNTMLLGNIFRQYFAPAEYGPWSLLEMFTLAGVLTTEEAAAFRQLWHEGLGRRWQDEMRMKPIRWEEVYGEE